jgi:DNA (cytosine-5)-methyltransferase 1
LKQNSIKKIDMRKAAKVIACVNHDVNAIASHQANHPECLHFTEDIRTLDLTELITVVRHAKTLHSDVGMLFIDLFCGAGGVTTGIEHADIFKGLEIESFSDKPLLCLWASLECTNFSKAKGGLPRDADSRTLANHLFRYMDACPFDLIFIENVEEFMAWGPLDENGKPLSKDRGFDYVNWISRMKAHSGGYNFEHRILNAADYGAHTSRRRYFGIFVRPGITIQFPKPTHSKKGTNGLQKWRAVKEVLDFSDEGESIFTRKKPLSERTLERIYAGLIKYVANGDASFIQKYYSGNPSNFVHSIDTTIGTITTIDHHSLVQPKFLAYYYGKHTLSDTNSPCGTLRTKDTAQLIQPKFWIDRQYGQGGGKTSSIDEPIGSLPTVPKANMASAWVLSPHFNNKGTSIEDPAPVITANRKHHYSYVPSMGSELQLLS